MYKVFTETCRGIQFREQPVTVNCGSDYFTVGERYTVFLVAEYDRLFPDDEANPVPPMIFEGVRKAATEELLADIFSADADSGERLFAPTFEAANAYIKQKDGITLARLMSAGGIVVDHITMRAKFASWGKAHIVIFDKEYGEYEKIWPRFGGLTAMYGVLDLTGRCNILLANENMFRMLYNQKTGRLYHIYEKMLLNDLDSRFNLKSLGDITYIVADPGEYQGEPLERFVFFPVMKIENDGEDIIF